MRSSASCRISATLILLLALQSIMQARLASTSSLILFATTFSASTSLSRCYLANFKSKTDSSIPSIFSAKASLALSKMLKSVPFLIVKMILNALKRLFGLTLMTFYPSKQAQRRRLLQSIELIFHGILL